MSPDVIDAMVAAGASAEVLAAAWKAEIAAQAEHAADRRAKDAERQRRHRESRSVTVTCCDDADPSPNEYISNPLPVPLGISNEIPPPAPESPKVEKPEPALKPEHVIEAWNDMAARHDLPKAKMTPERRRKLGTFIRRHPIEDITEAISAVERSRFCRGENDRGWRANIDFLLQPTSFTKLTEGTYDGTAN